MAAPSTIMSVLMDAVRKSAKGIGRDFGEVTELQVTKKGPSDFVTKTDLRVEQTLFELLTKARPGYGFLGEERGMVEGTDKTHTFVVDPIDGTTNFIHGIPHFAITVGLEREGEVIAAVTFNPITAEMFWAEKGKGAFLGSEKRLRVAGRKKLDECLIATGLPFAGKPGHAQSLKELHQIMPRVSGVRRFGAASLDLAWVAAGRFDAYWERNLKPWDVAAGLLLVREAGGAVGAVDEEGSFSDGASILAANLELQPLLLERLRAAGTPAAVAG